MHIHFNSRIDLGGNSNWAVQSTQNSIPYSNLPVKKYTVLLQLLRFSPFFTLKITVFLDIIQKNQLKTLVFRFQVSVRHTLMYVCSISHAAALLLQ